MTTPLRHVAPLVTPPLCKSGGTFRAIVLPPWVKGGVAESRGGIALQKSPFTTVHKQLFYPCNTPR